MKYGIKSLLNYMISYSSDLIYFNYAFTRDFVYCHTVLGTHFARVDHFQHDTSHEFWNSSPANIAHFPQNKFEAVLRKSMNSLTELKSIFSPSLFFGYDATDIKTSRQRNTLRIVKNSYPDPNQSAADISCDVLVGADGAHSAVRQAAGLKLQGHGALQSLLNVHFKCPGLSNFLSPRPAMLYFAFNEVFNTNIIHYALESMLSGNL